MWSEREVISNWKETGLLASDYAFLQYQVGNMATSISYHNIIPTFIDIHLTVTVNHLPTRGC